MAYRKDPASGAVSMSPIAGLPPLRILVTNTRVPKETGALVAGVRRLREAMPAVVDPLIASIDAVSHRAMDAVARYAAATAAESAAPAPAPAPPGAELPPSPPLAALLAELALLARINHALLNALGVGHEALDTVTSLSARAGLASKLTGAGGGGCAFTLLPADGTAGGEPELRALRDALQARGFDCFETKFGGDGARIDETAS